MTPRSTQLGAIKPLHAAKLWSEEASRIRELLDRINGEYRGRG